MVELRGLAKVTEEENRRACSVQTVCLLSRFQLCPSAFSWAAAHLLSACGFIETLHRDFSRQ